jgi:hypothetical protein
LSKYENSVYEILFKTGGCKFSQFQKFFLLEMLPRSENKHLYYPDLQKMNLEKKQLLPVNQIKTIEKNALLHDLKQIPKVLFIGSVAKK